MPAGMSCRNSSAGGKHLSRVKAAQPIGLAVLLLVFVPNLLNSLRFDWVLAQADTRTLAKRWIESNIEAGSRIAVEWPYHTPPLSNGFEVPPESAREYWIDRVYGFGLADRPIEQYQTDGTQYLIATSYIRRHSCDRSAAGSAAAAILRAVATSLSRSCNPSARAATAASRPLSLTRCTGPPSICGICVMLGRTSPSTGCPNG